ncbi:MAG: hypothetical protein K6A67_01490 [Bacteroidales bacterium]|nr:hypothetical protein [Bacteroidales bacterium]
MSKYLRKYTDKQAYRNDSTIPTDRSSVSVAGDEVEFVGKNVIIPYVSALLQVGDEKLFDKVDNCEKILKHGTYHAATFDSDRYVRSEAFFLKSYADIDLFVYKAYNGTKQWAANNEYKVTCDLTEDGGFSYSCTPYAAAISGSCSWVAGATIASVVAQLTVGSGLTVKAIGDNAIGFSLSTYNNGVITFTNVSNATILDCSFSARIGINGTEKGSHAGFQGQTVKSIFPTLEYMAASTACFCESGNNSSYYTNVRPSTFQSYYTNNGAATFKAESEAQPMKKSVWDALANAEDAAQKALYDKYGGDYAAYCLSRKMKRNINKGVNNSCREQGMAYTYALANCYFTDAEGNTKHVYPAAAFCAEFGKTTDGFTTGFEPGNWFMKSCVDLVDSLDPDTVTIINAAIATTTGGGTITWQSEWAVGEFSGISAWFYYATYGALCYIIKYNSYQVRALLASKHV